MAPNDISEDQFIQKYNEPDDRKPNQLIYDSNKDNDFSVLVNVKMGKYLLSKMLINYRELRKQLYLLYKIMQIF